MKNLEKVDSFFIKRYGLNEKNKLIEKEINAKELINSNRIDLIAKLKYIEYGTGLAFEVPEGYVMLIFPRSSVSKYDLSLANAVGVLDSSYRGELKLRFKRNYVIKHLGDNKTLEKSAFEHRISPTEILICDKIYEIGDKVGQIMIVPYPQIEFNEVEELSETQRGSGGFGSTDLVKK